MSFKAVYYQSVNDVILRSTDFESVGPSETIIRVEACGICGTDINAIRRGSSEYLQVGHEIAGLLDSTGNCTERRVVLESSSACGRCEACRNGRSQLCTDVKSFFRRPYFGLAEQMISPEISVLPYFDIEPAVATLAEPLGVSIDLCEVAQISPYSVVLVVGLGPIGLMALRLAKLAGARKIYASTFSKREKRNALALEFGADQLLFEDEHPLADQKLDPPPDRILHTAPPNAIGACVPSAALGAIVTFIGVGHGETDRVMLPANDFHFKKLQLRSSFAAPAQRTPMALELLKTKRIDGERLISHRFPLSDAAEAIRVACQDKNNSVKVVVVNQ